MRRHLRGLLRHLYGGATPKNPYLTPGDIEGDDSLTVLALLFYIEGEFGVDFTARQLRELRDLRSLERFLILHARR